MAVLVAGYGWLGAVVDGAFGAAVGCAAGLILCALLHLLVGSALSGAGPGWPPRLIGAGGFGPPA